MNLSIQQLTKDIASIDFADILSTWQWLVKDMTAVVTVSVLGDIFLMGDDDAIYWLQTDSGELTKIASSLDQFDHLLNDENNIDNWFLPLLVEKLIIAGKTLKENEVYSYLKSPIIGGEYDVANIVACDMSVHFSFAGQLLQQVNNLPDGTKVRIKYEPHPRPQN